MALPWAKAQAAYPSATLALGHLSPTLALATYPSYGRADQQGGQQRPQGQQANPTQKARKAICCPRLLPGTLTRLQMRSLHSDPRRRAAKNFTSLSAEMQTLQRQRKGNSKAPLVTEQAVRLRRTLGSCLGSSSTQLSLFGQRSGESGSSFTEEVTSSHVSPGHRLSMMFVPRDL